MLYSHLELGQHEQFKTLGQWTTFKQSRIETQTCPPIQPGYVNSATSITG